MDPLPHQPTRIILIEDTFADIRLVRELLDAIPSFRYELRTGGSLAEGLEMLSSGPCDILLLDLGRSASGGMEALTALVASHGQVPIIVLTDREDERGGIEALVRGAQDYLAKDRLQGSSLRRAIRYAIKRKEAEAELNASLELRLQERTAQLERSNAELAAFAYSISHDLRAPLRTIDGFAAILVEDYRDRLDEDGGQCVDRIRAASLRMGGLIEDVLKLARISRSPVRNVTVDLSALAREVAGELGQQDPARQVEWVIEPELVARGDERLLRILLTNLLGNAWKFTGGKEGARIEFGTAPQTDGPKAYFVRDNGAGFDMAYAGKLFGAFQRLHTEREFPGSGIGLATARRIVHLHGGHVWAEGAVGEGATFFFTLGGAA